MTDLGGRSRSGRPSAGASPGRRLVAAGTLALAGLYLSGLFSCSSGKKAAVGQDAGIGGVGQSGGQGDSGSGGGQGTGGRASQGGGGAEIASGGAASTGGRAGSGPGGAVSTGGRGAGGSAVGGATGAANYTSWTDCGQDGGNNPAASQCLCDAVNQCAAFLGWVFQALGSDRYRVCGYRDGQCVIAGFNEVEGDGKGTRCLVPLGSSVCTDGRMLKAALAATCQQTFQCNVMLGDCPADPIACPP